jgi:hypothetical protein
MTKRQSCAAVIVWIVTVGFSTAADNDRVLMLRGEGLAGTMYTWEIPQSSVAALPRWDPLRHEVPLSPQQAAVAATKFLHDRFGPSAQLVIESLCLQQSAVRPEGTEAPGAQVWDYQILFDCKPKPPSKEIPLLNVMVLMDGKVVVPTAKPYK